MCKDMNLSIERQNYSGLQLRTDGYYYEDSDTSNDVKILFFYRDGVFLDGGFESLNDAENGAVKIDISNALSKQTKYVWGAFQIIGNTLEIEHWRPINSGCYKTLYIKGEIQDDSTFVITHRENRDKNGEVLWKESPNSVCHFRAIPQKPDSTNDFVK